ASDNCARNSGVRLQQQRLLLGQSLDELQPSFSFYVVLIPEILRRTGVARGTRHTGLPFPFCDEKVFATFWHVGPPAQLRVIPPAHRRPAPGCELAIRVFEFCRKT